jgi:SMC interacting uncharacterized protein involved in chromosome segregation
MVDQNILEIFYEWLIRHRSKIEREVEDNCKLISHIEIPYHIFYMIRKISEKDNLDGIYDEMIGAYTCTSYVAYCEASDEKQEEKQEFVVIADINMSGWNEYFVEEEIPHEGYKKLDYI